MEDLPAVAQWPGSRGRAGGGLVPCRNGAGWSGRLQQQHRKLASQPGPGRSLAPTQGLKPSWVLGLHNSRGHCSLGTQREVQQMEEGEGLEGR